MICNDGNTYAQVFAIRDDIVTQICSWFHLNSLLFFSFFLCRQHLNMNVIHIRTRILIRDHYRKSTEKKFWRTKYSLIKTHGFIRCLFSLFRPFFSSDICNGNSEKASNWYFHLIRSRTRFRNSHWKALRYECKWKNTFINVSLAVNWCVTLNWFRCTHRLYPNRKFSLQNTLSGFAIHLSDVVVPSTVKFSTH